MRFWKRNRKRTDLVTQVALVYHAILVHRL